MVVHDRPTTSKFFASCSVGHLKIRFEIEISSTNIIQDRRRSFRWRQLVVLCVLCYYVRFGCWTPFISGVLAKRFHSIIPISTNWEPEMAFGSRINEIQIGKSWREYFNSLKADELQEKSITRFSPGGERTNRMNVGQVEWMSSAGGLFSFCCNLYFWKGVLYKIRRIKEAKYEEPFQESTGRKWRRKEDRTSGDFHSFLVAVIFQ